MKEVVYIIGAGINQVVKDWDGDSPPLLSNFFNVALRKRKFREKHYVEQIQNVYDYIEKHFKKNIDDLSESPFDLELCFSLLERQIKEAQVKNETEELRRLVNVHFRLKAFVAEVLSDFEHFADNSHTMRNFGKVVLHEQPTLITFNYDCLLESILEHASGVNISVPYQYLRHNPLEREELSDELLIYSHCNWNRPLGYGFKFDELELQQAGIPEFVKGSRFYSVSQNQLYSKPLLKLHGSLNWFRYLPIRSFPTFPGETQPELGERASYVILYRGTWWFGRPPDCAGWLIDPVIITPVLYKDEYYNERPFKEIWEHARDALAKCKKLVIIGYSFSPTDFSTKRLLIESLMENDLEELVVVNPDYNVLKVAKDLCHFCGGLTWYSNLDDYLKSFSKIIRLETKMEEIPEEKLPKDTSPHDVYAKCKTCGIEFKVGIRTNPRSFATSQFIGNVAECPNGHANSYDKDDYILKKVQNEKI
jgi:hypothetical protein